MRTRVFFYVVGLSLMVLMTMPAGAQTNSFTYQGSLSTSGTPANGNHDFEFALFDAAPVGVQVGSTLTRSGVAVVNGVFSVSLDFGSQFPGANRFLEVRVRTSGGGAFTTLLPRQPVNSSPYAIRSANASSLGGIPSTSYVVSGSFSITASTQFNLGTERVLSISGTSNLFVGANAGSNNTGTSNSFVGSGAGSQNTTGGSNAFFGAGAGGDNADGSENSFFGVNAGRGNLSGIRNTFIGRLAGRSNTTGTDNTFVGFNAGADGVGGSFNTAFGSAAGQNTVGASNAFFGGEAGAANNMGVGNAFFGRLAGSESTTGDNNTFLGRTAGNTNTVGNDNTVVGSLADVGANNLTNATAIGARALATQNNSLVLGSINGVNGATANTRVGIGTTAPINRLTIGEPETPILNSAVGIFNSGGTYMTVRDTTNNVEGLFGADNSDFNHAPTSGSVIVGSMSSHKLVFRVNNQPRAWIAENGSFNVGDGQFLNTARMHVYGGIDVRHLEPGGDEQLCYVSGPVAPLAVCSSSIRYKENIRNFGSGMEVLRRLRPVVFNWKKSGTEDMGLIAEEVSAVEPLLATTNANGEIEGVKYDRVGVVLVNAVKEQQAEIESQKKEISDLRSQVDALKKFVSATNATADVCKP